MLGRALGCAVFLSLLLPAGARAFTIESPIGDGCHERITTGALVDVPFAADVPTWPADDAHRRLAASVPFTVPAAGRADPRVLALLLGVRSPDIGDLAVTDLDRLAMIHGDPSDQMQHCLRGPTDDYAAGDVSALAACRAAILAELDAALGPGDTVDAGTEDVVLSLAFEGPRTVTLPRFPYRLGRALHALQDSFPHAYRDATGEHVLTVHNWVDWVGDDFDPARDGVRHQSDRDHCEGGPLVLARVAHAKQASEDLLSALADPSGGRAGRLTRAAAVLDHWLALDPGCSDANAWCGSPDGVVAEGSCSAAPGRAPAAVTFAVLALAALAVALRRRRALGPLALVAALALPTLAHAQAPPAPRETAAAEASAPAPAVVAAGARAETPLRAWGVSVTAAAALESPSLAFSAGARWFPCEALRVGLDVEWSPWLSTAALRGAPGVVDAYASLEWDWARVPGVVRIGSRVALGLSVLLFDLVGANAGDVGPYVAATLVGAGFDVAPGWEVRLDPEASVAVPHLVGVPLVYREYRLALSVVWRP